VCMKVYDSDMGRTNVVVDDDLIERAMRLYNLKTKREAIDLALRRLVGEYKQIDILELEGMGWEGDLDEMRESRFPTW
jgi:Arc/MetJ family transcription regulator